MAKTKTRSYTRRSKKGKLSRVKSYVRKNKGKSIGVALGAGVTVGALVLAGKKRKQNPTIIKPSGPKGSPANPVVQIPKPPKKIGERSSFQSKVKKTFLDPLTGKTRKRGGFLPGIKKGDIDAKVIQEPPAGLKQTIAIEQDRPGVKYELDRRPKKQKPLNLKKKKD